MSNVAYIYDAVRTPRGKGKSSGALHEVKPVVLGSTLLKELQTRHDLDTSCVDDVIMGCTAPVSDQGGNIAKSIAQFANWHESVSGVQLDRFCGSGLEAVNMAAAKVMSGWEQLIIAGGVESMSRVPMGRAGSLLDDPEQSLHANAVPQGIGADLIATIGNWSREDIDAYAVLSQKRAAHAQSGGYFDRSIVPVKDLNGLTILERDEYLRPDTTLESLAALSPAFEALGRSGLDALALKKYFEVEVINHVHTAGNSSGIVDGASAVLIGSERVGKDLGLEPRARIVSGAVTATDPVIMLTGPAPAVRKCLAKAGLGVSDIDLFEINEAFASVVLRFMKDMGIDKEVTNVNGGAIALGHPLGATGGMLVGAMLDELERRDLKRGLITLCVAGGMGIATVIERL